MTLRKAVFWLHLLTGTIAGAVILVMAATGALLAFEPQLVEWAERELRIVPSPAADGRRIELDALVSEARRMRSDAHPTAVTVRADPRSSVRVGFGREGALYFDPYTGTMLGAGSKVHDALHVVEDWHRWLGSRDLGRPITGACNLAFLGMAITGVYLWWPRATRAGVWKAVVVPSLRLRGRARDFNWHNAIGIWCAPVLIVLTLTGAVMSYQWANDLLYRLTGNEPPPPPSGGPGGTRQARGRPDGASLDTLRARAESHVPGWVVIPLRLPQRPGAPVVAVVQEPPAWHPAPRSQLTLDASTADILKWEPYASQNLGRRLRTWVRPLHTGEAAGVAGQTVAGLASVGGICLVYTGIALAWRRLRGWMAPAEQGRWPADLRAAPPSSPDYRQ
jgi:uncharacterized iron-regulated membrane protein